MAGFSLYYLLIETNLTSVIFYFITKIKFSLQPHKQVLLQMKFNLLSKLHHISIIPLAVLDRVWLNQVDGSGKLATTLNRLWGQSVDETRA